MSKVSEKILHGNERLKSISLSNLTVHAIIRNLQCILNTRSALGVMQYLKDNAQLDNLTFGIPDISSLSMASSSSQQILCELIKKAIRNFETRLEDVSVILGDYDPVKREINVKVSAYFNRDNMAVNILLNLSTLEFFIDERERQ